MKDLLGQMDSITAQCDFSYLDETALTGEDISHEFITSES